MAGGSRNPRLVLFWQLLAGLGALRVGLYLLSSGPLAYGYLADEFYYLACAERLAWGYVDHPPLSIALLAGIRTGLGDSLLALRLLPSLAHAAAVFLCALLARELGGGRAAQGLTAVAVLAAPVYLGVSSFYSMNALEPALWAASALVLVRIVDGAPPRAWLVLGVLLGLGLQTKLSTLWLGFGIAVGLVATSERRWLATPWPWSAAGLAALLASPYALWLARHGWPLLEFMRNATSNKMVEKGLLQFAGEQLLMVNPLIAPLWMAGLLFLFASRAGRRYRLLGWIWLSVFALLAASGTARANYLGPAYALLLPAGGVAFERMARARSWGWLPPVAASVFAFAGIASAPLAIPLLPPSLYVRYEEALGIAPPVEEQGPQSQLPLHFALRFGWEDIRRAVGEGLAVLSPAEQERAVVLGAWFGDTGMINFYRERDGLPRAISGHNNYWLWGPGDASGDVLIVLTRDGPERLRRWYRRVEAVDEVGCTWCMPDTARLVVYVCRDPRRAIDDWWPEVKRYE